MRKGCLAEILLLQGYEIHTSTEGFSPSPHLVGRGLGEGWLGPVAQKPWDEDPGWTDSSP
jgi:hypothetical protein